MMKGGEIQNRYADKYIIIFTVVYLYGFLIELDLCIAESDRPASRNY